MTLPDRERQLVLRSLRRAQARAAHEHGVERHNEAVAKRSYGTGSLSVRKDARQGRSWYGQWWVGGRRVTRKVGTKRETGTRVGLTRSQAERKLQRLIDAETAAPVDERLSLGVAGEMLISQLEARGRKRSTIGEYRSYLNMHLAPFFGDKPLDKVTPASIESFIAAKRREGKATKSILNYLGLLHSIFEFGCRRGFARTNPTKLVDKPERAGASPDIRFLDETELEALIRAVPTDARGSTERVLYVTAAMTGLRQGELLGLRWQDIDWMASRVRVRQSFVRGEFGSPKTRRSSRSVPLADRVAIELERTPSAAPTEATKTWSSAIPRRAPRSTVRDCSSGSRPPPSGRSCVRFDSMTCATRSGPGWPGPGSQCARCRSGWATGTPRRPRSTRTTSPATARPSWWSARLDEVPIRVPI